MIQEVEWAIHHVESWGFKPWLLQSTCWSGHNPESQIAPKIVLVYLCAPIESAAFVEKKVRVFEWVNVVVV